MKFILILFTLFSFMSYSQNTELNNLFLDVPLNSSRDSIYDYLTKSNHFIKDKISITYSGNFPKTFSGNYVKSSTEFRIKHSDSIGIQLTFGNVTVDGEKESKNQLIFYCYYYISNSRYAKRILKSLKSRIGKLTKEKPYYLKAYRKGENDEKKRYIGYSYQWYFKNKENIEIDLNYEVIKVNKNYRIELQYSRNE